MAVHFEKTIDSKLIYTGHVITVTQDTALLENGETALRDVVHHHGGACILPYFEDGTICMVRQFRYAMQQELWELPAGKLEAGEDPFEAAKRELTEECGVTADEYIPLGQIYPTVGYDTEVIYIWAARGLHPAPMHLDADEFLTPRPPRQSLRHGPLGRDQRRQNRRRHPQIQSPPRHRAYLNLPPRPFARKPMGEGAFLRLSCPHFFVPSLSRPNGLDISPARGGDKIGFVF